MRWFFLMVMVFLLMAVQVEGQITQGGRPLEVPVLKSRGTPEIVMPMVQNYQLRLFYEDQVKQDPKLKPFRFAHGFDVEIAPASSGQWIRNVEGYDVWRVKIRSTGAYSLNLIFSDFELPEGARLFLFNENEGHYLGAFTSANNKISGKFAVSPVAGDELVVQYEVPSGSADSNDFIIKQVNHDYIGIVSKSERRPLGSSGTCNIDINCDIAGDWAITQDAVCRIIVKGQEICSGVLVNNTAENQRPYVLSAAHCYDSPEHAEESVFTFNYESPYCAPLDGDPSNSLSGASLKAHSDSLDFALVEMSIVPPPSYRPYFAGWNRSSNMPDSSASIHHPKGDIKKIAIDRNAPGISNFGKGYTPNGFLRIFRWEEGVTEEGSSGAPLFNPAGHVVGTLTGGNATCSNPVNDYYSRFDMAWNYKPDSAQQLKYWLDPNLTNAIVQPGRRFYEGDNLCMAFTNLEDYDQHGLIALNTQSGDAGYWGGTNSLNITEFVEKFSIAGDELLQGVSIGVGEIKLNSQVSNSEITLKIYNGNLVPQTLIHFQKVRLLNLVSGAMNYIPFDKPVVPAETFFVGFELSNLRPDERFVMYQSLREQKGANFFWFRRNNQWYNFQDANTDRHSIANVISLIACNVNEEVPPTDLVTRPMDAIIYPNPAKNWFTFEAGQEISLENIRIYNLTGQEVQAKLQKSGDKKILIDLADNLPGIYFVRFNSKLGSISEKVMYVPW